MDLLPAASLSNLKGEKMNNNENNNIRFEDLVGDNQQNQAPNNNPPIWEVNNNGGKKGTDTYSLVSMILGILSLVLCCCVNYVPIILGVAAIVLYAMAKKNDTANGMAVAGLVCGIIGVVFGLIGVVLSLAITEEMLLEWESMLNSMLESSMM